MSKHGVRRVEYIFGPKEVNTGHSLGVTALERDPDCRLLFSGGRGGRINAWSLEGPIRDAAVRTVNLHTNTITGLQTSPDSRHIVSTSADTTVKLWDPWRDDGVGATLGHHSDYAQCVALEGDHAITGGLDSRVFGWDLQHSTPSSQPAYRYDSPCSVYAIAGAPNLVASGGHDGVVRLWDPRTPKQVAKLTGHTDTVRQLAVVGSDYVLSASSDTSIRLWSLAARRAVRTWSHHNDSVWSLYVNDSEFWSGDRSGNVYRAPLFPEEPTADASSTHQAEYICTESRGVKAMVFDPKHDEVWVASQVAPEIHKYAQRPQGDSNMAWTLVHETEGHAALRKHRLLNDKRHALVCDTEGKVDMVDLVTAKLVPGFGRQVPESALQSYKTLDDALDEIQAEVNTLDVLDNWCAVAIRAGMVCVSLDAPSICNTEVYADELIPDEQVTEQEKRIVLGTWVLRSLLRPVLEDRLAAYRALTPPNSSGSDNATNYPPSPDPSTDHSSSGTGEESNRRRFLNKLLRRNKPTKDEVAAEEEAASGSEAPGSSGSGTSNNKNGEEQKDLKPPETFAESWDRVVSMRNFKVLTPIVDDEPPLLDIDPGTQIVVTEVAPGAGAPTEVWRGSVGGLLQDAVSIQKVLPGWVGDALMLGKLPSRAHPNVGFNVNPIEGLFNSSVELPPVVCGKTRLVAVTMLRARKIMIYIINQLQREGLLPEEALQRPPEDVVQLLCAGNEVQPKMTLATIRTRIWRSGGDVSLQYRLK